MPDTALVVMARYPEVGATKTRLARAIGVEEAAHLYRAFLTDLAQRFAGQPYDLHWAYTPNGVGYVLPAAGQMVGIWTHSDHRPGAGSDQSSLYPSESRAGWPRISRGRHPGDAGWCGARPAFACRINLTLAHLLMLVQVGLWTCRRAIAVHRAPMLL
jgi:hypothetical protein